MSGALRNVALHSFKRHSTLIAVSWLSLVAIIICAIYLGATVKDFLPLLFFTQSKTIYLPFFPFLIVASFAILLFPSFFIQARNHSFSQALKKYTEHLEEKIHAYVRSPQLWDGVAALTAMLPFSIFFCVGKSLIPHITHYSWDPALSHFDKVIHFGRYPHEYLVAIVDEFSLYGFFDKIYYAFFPVLFIAQTYCIFLDRDLVRRHRYLWCSLVGWIVFGWLLAGIFASVGPLFYADFYPDSPYTFFIDYLFKTEKARGLTVVPLSRVLYEWTTDKSLLDFNSISAMPSMHVAAVTLTVLYSRTISKPIFFTGTVFLILTMMATVYLGLHYAVDGYAGIILIGALWYISGLIAIQKRLASL